MERDNSISMRVDSIPRSRQTPNYIRITWTNASSDVPCIWEKWRVYDDPCANSTRLFVMDPRITAESSPPSPEGSRQASKFFTERFIVCVTKIVPPIPPSPFVLRDIETSLQGFHSIVARDVTPSPATSGYRVSSVEELSRVNKQREDRSTTRPNRGALLPLSRSLSPSLSLPHRGVESRLTFPSLRSSWIPSSGLRCPRRYPCATPCGPSLWEAHVQGGGGRHSLRSTASDHSIVPGSDTPRI